MVDDHSRLAYAEIHPDQRAITVVGFLERALAFDERHGISPKRLMTDNAWVYVKSRELRRLLEAKRSRPDRRRRAGLGPRASVTGEWAS